MQKYRSFMLPRVRDDSEEEELPTEQAAQESLFEISKRDDNLPHFDIFLRELNKLSLNKKRYQKLSVSLPKKRPSEETPHEPIVFRPTHLHSLSSHEPVSISTPIPTQPTTCSSTSPARPAD
jgi:hypothetical protein